MDVVVEAVVEKPESEAVLAGNRAKSAPGYRTGIQHLNDPHQQAQPGVLQRPENFCGMHFFNPVHRMPLVEVIRGEKTSDKTVPKVVARARQNGQDANRGQ